MSTFIDVRDEEVGRLLAPWVHEELARDSHRWRALVRRATNKARRLRWRRAWRDVFKWRRGVQQVHHEYDQEIWPAWDLSKMVVPKGKPVPVVWRNRAFLAGAMATKRVHLLYLMRVIAALEPLAVLEVGSGAGINLLLLAARFPDVQLTGLELTAAGTAATRQAGAAGLAPAVHAFSPEPQTGVTAGTIALVQGNGAALPFADRTFDLVYTVQALEQAESVRDSALAEIARVTRGPVAMVEPFRDWNADGHRRDRIVGKEYFAAATCDLAVHGLVVEYMTGDLPTKLAMGVGFVLARRADTAGA